VTDICGELVAPGVAVNTMSRATCTPSADRRLLLLLVAPSSASPAAAPQMSVSPVGAETRAVGGGRCVRCGGSVSSAGVHLRLSDRGDGCDLGKPGATGEFGALSRPRCVFKGPS
jgi:hypothetical protein